MQRCWQLLQAVAADALDMPASQHGARKAALLQGSQQYLQRGHAAYMQTIIQSHRSEVCPCQAVTASLSARADQTLLGTHMMTRVFWMLGALSVVVIDSRPTRWQSEGSADGAPPV